MKPTICRRYFCTRNVNADSSPVLTRSMISASVAMSLFADMAIAVGSTPPKFNTPRSMATVPTPVGTPAEPESCVTPFRDSIPEVLWGELLVGRPSGLFETGIGQQPAKRLCAHGKTVKVPVVMHFDHPSLRVVECPCLPKKTVSV